MKWRSLAGVVLGVSVLLFSIVVYWPGLSGGFFFDDSANILEPMGVRLTAISPKSLLDALESGVGGPLGRPVAMLTFAVNYYFTGFEPFFFKVTNLLIHCLNGVLVYLVTVLFHRAADPAGRAGPGLFPVMVAGLWLVHPIQLTSVLYAVQRMTSLAAMFMLIGLILHVWARQRSRTGAIEWLCFALAWGLCFPLAVLSKESALLFVLYVSAYEVVLQRNLRQGFDQFGRLFMALVLFALVASLMYLVLPGAGVLQGYDIRNFTLEQRLLTELRIIWIYIGQILIPVLGKFALYHDDFVVSTGILEPKTTMLAAFGLAALFVLCWVTRIRLPLVSFGVLWFIVGHGLESTIFPLELMHEHRNYLPSLGMFVALAAVVQVLSREVNGFKVVAPALFVAFFLYTALLTSFRADMYGNDFRRTQIEAAHRVDSVRSQYEAGALLVSMYTANPNQMLADMAEVHFRRVNFIDPKDKLALIGQLQLDCLSKKESRAEVYEELRSRLTNGKFLAMDRAVMNAVAEMSNVGTLCLSREQVDELFRVAIGNPVTTLEDRSVMRSDHVLYLWEGKADYPAAREELLTAIGENPNDVLNAINLLKLSVFVGNVDDMMKALGYLEGKQLKRQDRPIVQSIIDRLKADGVSVDSPSRKVRGRGKYAD